MSQVPGSFRPVEIAGADRDSSEADVIAAVTTARELERALPMESIGPSAGFADRVMAVVAREPVPRPLGFLAGLRARPGPTAFAASVRDAWGMATRGSGRPGAARGMAMAYVLAVFLIGASITGFAAYGWAGALGFLDGEASPSPSPTLVVPSPGPSAKPTPEASTSAPVASEPPVPSESPEPSSSPEPVGSNQPPPSDDHGGPAPTAVPSRPPATPEPLSSPGPSDDHGLDNPSQSPEAAATLQPSDTPQPSETTQPSESPT
ncbi:MAG: hypothetical protein ABIV26_00520 [Candidatus Limnocylindrales bacterium]